MTGPLRLPTGEFFQLGYVSHDLERAIAHYQEHHGIERFAMFDNRAMLEAEGSDAPFMRVALAYLGPVMIELIEPEPGRDSIYAHALRADGGIALHHLGYLVEPAAFAGLEADLVANDVDIPIVRRGSMALLYADTRPMSGLFSEFVQRSDALDAFFADVPCYSGFGASIPGSGPAAQIETARRLLTAVGLSDIATLQDLMAEDATWWSYTQGDRENGVPKASFLEGYKTGMARLFGSPVEFDILGITASADRVAIEANSRATLAKGGHYANKYHFLFQFRNGCITRVREYMDTAYMNAAFTL